MKITVPDGMLKAAIAQALVSGKVMNRRQWTEFFTSGDSICTRFTREILEAALEWLAENPQEGRMVASGPIPEGTRTYGNCRVCGALLVGDKCLSCGTARDLPWGEGLLTCGCCGQTMTRENSTVAPEFFLCDPCAKAKAPPAPVDAGLVERMCAAGYEGPHRQGMHAPKFSQASDVARNLWILDMTAALRVAAGALLGPVTPAEWSLACPKREDGVVLAGNAVDIATTLLANRSARLLAPAKTVEERVDVVESAMGVFHIHVDGARTAVSFSQKADAHIYCLGLIATLKEKH